MGCNTSKETSVKPNEEENKENAEDKSSEEGIKQNEDENHITELDSKDTNSSSARTITIRSNGTTKSEENKDDVKSEEQAATKIQAVFRGHQTRKSMKQPQAQQQDDKEPTREELENEFRLDDPELCNAATKIQASFRGHLTRKHMDGDKKGDESSSKQEEELDIDLTDPDLNKAAAKIQASFRGHLNRKDGEGTNSSK
ncbi:uncharacterized protein LOC115885211 [Sitophilus oryzae]|uniref:Uncharacterized protein LOC115885211 n=1 Tax=Sitophilus oryzae TaxID=7048 RepID=A0A6J2Y9M4_SITOR|nr:uncharacterized protein LOC115885211 [Sitophilus oryzae]